MWLAFCLLSFFFGVSGCRPLSAEPEAVETFGSMHVLIATKGHENLTVTLANRKRVDGSTLSLRQMAAQKLTTIHK